MHYLDAVKAIANLAFKGVYIIDYQKHIFEYVSDYPLFLCGNSAKEIKKLGFAFYSQYVTPSDYKLLITINTEVFNFYNQLPSKQRKEYIASYDFHLKNHEDNMVLINQKSIPLSLTNSGELWKVMCVVSESTEMESGHLKMYRKGGNKIHVFDFDRKFWKATEKITLSDTEKIILRLSVKGQTIKTIAASLFLSPDSIKYHKRKLYEKLNVSNTLEAIKYAIDNELI